MSSTKLLSRVLGCAFLLQIFAPLVGDLLCLQPLLVEENVIETLMNINDSPIQFKLGLLLQLFTIIGIGTIGTLMCFFLQKYNQPMARLARLLYTIEGTFLGISVILLYGVFTLSEESGAMEISEASRVLASLLFSLHTYAIQIHMFFFAFGACLFYYLFFKFEFIPKALAVLGLIAAPMSVIGIIMTLMGVNVPIYVFILSLPFELITGIWFLFNIPNSKEIHEIN